MKYWYKMEQGDTQIVPKIERAGRKIYYKNVTEILNIYYKYKKKLKNKYIQYIINTYNEQER